MIVQVTPLPTPTVLKGCSELCQTIPVAKRKAIQLQFVVSFNCIWLPSFFLLGIFQLGSIGSGKKSVFLKKKT